MPRVVAFAVLAATAAGLALASARADQPSSCFKRHDLLTYLANNFKEAPIAGGLTDAGMLLAVYSSKTGETWTIAVTTPAGLTCRMATGQDWQLAPRIAAAGPPA